MVMCFFLLQNSNISLLFIQDIKILNDTVMNIVWLVLHVVGIYKDLICISLC